MYEDSVPEKEIPSASPIIEKSQNDDDNHASEIQSPSDTKGILHGTESPENTAIDVDQILSLHSDKIKQFLQDIIHESQSSSGLGETQEPTEQEKFVQALAEKEKELNLKQLQFETLAILEEKSIPPNMMHVLIGSDLNATRQNIEVFQQEFNKAVQLQVEKRLAGRSPTNSNNMTVNNQYLATIKNIINGR